MAAQAPPPLHIPRPAVPRTPVTIEDVRKAHKHAHVLNNCALKSIRDAHEDPRGVPTVNYIDLFDQDPYPIKQVVRFKGVEYTLREPRTPWSWRAFLNGMDDDTLERVVGTGLAGIMLAALPGSYDHKRHWAARQLGIP